MDLYEMIDRHLDNDLRGYEEIPEVLDEPDFPEEFTDWDFSDEYDDDDF